MKVGFFDELGVYVERDMTPEEEAQAPLTSAIEVRADAWEGIKRERERRQKAGVRVGSNWFHSDPDSRTQQLGLVMIGANLPVGLQWKTLTGAFVTMTPSLAAQIFQASTAHDMAMFGYAEQLKASLESMTREQLLEIDVRQGWVGTGWPETFEE